MAEGICSHPTRECDTQVKKLEQRKYIGWVHSFGFYTKRIFWKLTKVEELFPRKDGQIRFPRVMVANSERNHIRILGVIQHLIPLEVTLSEEIDKLGRYEKAEEHRHREREGRCGWNYKQLYTTATKDRSASRDCMLEEKH